MLLGLRDDSQDRQWLVVACDNSIQSSSQFEAISPVVVDARAPLIETGRTDNIAANAQHGKLAMQPEASWLRFVIADHLSVVGECGHPFRGWALRMPECN